MNPTPMRYDPESDVTPTHGWGAIAPGRYVLSFESTRTEAIDYALGLMIHPDRWETPEGRRREWDRLRREGFRVERVLTHSLRREAAIHSALARARAALRRSGLTAAEGMDIPRLYADLDALLSL